VTTARAQQRLAVSFARTASEVPAADPGSIVVVLDPAWTPTRDDPATSRSVRPYQAIAIEGHDLFEEALDLLDAWADAAQLPDRLLVNGVTYWYRMRETAWRWLHERLLWAYTVGAIEADLMPGGGAAAFAVPAESTALTDVLRALHRDIAPHDRESASSRLPSGPRDGSERPRPDRSSRRPLSRSPKDRGPIDRVFAFLSRRLSSGGPWAPVPPGDRSRALTLAARVERFAAGDRPIVVLTTPSTYQHVYADGRHERRDPQLGSVIDSLGREGLPVVLIGFGLDPRRDDDWAKVEADDRLLPQSLMRTRWGDPGDDAQVAEVKKGVLDSLGATATPLSAAGVDLSPALLSFLQTAVENVVSIDAYQWARIDRLLAELRPRAIVLAQEGVRTAWLAAAARAAVPTFAIQHGVLYRRHPGYPPARHPRLVLPTTTFVFGADERRVLLDLAYRPDEVVVSGSPRHDLDNGSDSDGGADGERSRIRGGLGVSPGQRLVVVSTVNLEFVRGSHLVHMIERLLGAPLPFVHVVFKQHPGETDPGPYRALLEGLAACGGYDPPPIDVVKEIDLYALLRAADAHVGLHSTVLTDAVAAGCLNLIAMVEPHADLLGYVAAGVARPVRSVDDVLEALDHGRPPDAETRQAFLDDHFQSGHAGSRIATWIREAVAGGATATGGATTR
jgi:hypothetical protein